MTKDEQIQALTKALAAIANGSEPYGRWLDANGAECDEDDPGAAWYEYTDEEQSEWIDSVRWNAANALQSTGFGHMVED